METNFKMSKEDWIKKQEKVYANEGFDEPDRLIKNLGTKTESRFEELIKIVESIDKPILFFLDAGSASGAIGKYLVEKYPKVYAHLVDLPEVTKKIKIITTKYQDRIIKIPLDLNKVFPHHHRDVIQGHSNYDIINACGVIEHLYNDWFFIENCFLRLNKNGYLIITAPMLETMFGQEDSLHIRIYPAQMLDSLLKLAGFKIIKSWEENGRKRIVAQK